MDNRILKLQQAAKRARATGGKGYLYTPEGKRLLRDARILDLQWPQLTRVFARSQGCLENLFSFHGIKKLHPAFLNWNAVMLALVRKFYKRSIGIQSVSDSSRLSLEMFQSVNAERRKQGLNRVSLNAIRCFAKDHGMRWGWRSWDGKPAFSNKEKSIVRRHFVNEAWPELRALLPKRSREEILRCGKQLCLKRPRSMYSEQEIALLRQAVEDSKKAKDDGDFLSITAALEAKLGRTLSGIEHKMNDLGIKWHYRQASIESGANARMWKP